MINVIKRMLGIKTVDYAELVKEGAVILDVRTKGEFGSGHIKGAINIPVEQLAMHLGRLPDKQKPVITCCASGMRSGIAKRMLQAKGYATVYNGGSWIGLTNKI